MNSVTGSLSLCLVLSCSGTPTLLCVLLNCLMNSETLASQVGIDSSERWACHVKAGPSNDCTTSLRHSAPFCATGPHLGRECALTHSILIEKLKIRRNEARSARDSFIIQTDAPLSQSSGFIVQSIIRTGNRKRPEWLLWVECSSNNILLMRLVFPANHGRSGHFDCCQIFL